MFTGLVQSIGEVTAIDKRGDWVITVSAPTFDMGAVVLGASIACNGICLTVIEKDDHHFKVQLSTETLSKTTAMKWVAGTRINLEPALRFGDELGGHLVTGHVDGVAYVTERRKEGDSLRYRFEAPRDFVRFVAPKGSVALDGVSLTINDVWGGQFGVNIIPHTQNHTTFGTLVVGQSVNFEVDMLARYIDRLMGARENTPPSLSVAG